MYKFDIDKTNTGILIGRIIIGLSYMFIHGLPKLIGGPELWAKIGGAMKVIGFGFYPIMWGFIAGFTEFFGGFLLLVGLFYRPAIIFMVFTMIIAMMDQLFIYGEPFSKAAYPLEMAAALIILFSTGPGKYSIENMLLKKKH